MTNENKEEGNIFEKKIMPVLQYIGAIGAGLMSVMYIVVVVVLITGFKASNLQQAAIFAVVNAIVGLIIMQFLKIQGISFAKNLPKNKKILDEYYNNTRHDKKPKSINSYWASSLAKDILMKGISVMATTAGLIYIVIQGSNDYNLLLLALVNLILFICFGLLALNSAYEFYNNMHIPYIKGKILELNNKKEENECLTLTEKNLET